MQLWFTRLPAVKDEVFPVTGDWDHDEGTATCPQGSATTLAALSDSEEDKLAPLTSGSGGEKRKNSDTDRRARGSVCEAALLRGVPINGDEEDSVCVVPRPVEENVECQIGGMVFSSTCCVVLVIFALLFVLAGSVLAFIVYHQVDVRVIKFLTNYNYLKVASPLMICLGLVMLLFGTVFWIAKRKRKPRCVDYTNQSPSHVHPDSYFSPTDISPTPRSSTAARGRGSLSSGADNQEWHCTSPICPRVSSTWTALCSESSSPQQCLLNNNSAAAAPPPTSATSNKWTLPPLPTYLCISQNPLPVPLECETLLSKCPDAKKMPSMNVEDPATDA